MNYDLICKCGHSDEAHEHRTDRRCFACPCDGYRPKNTRYLALAIVLSVFLLPSCHPVTDDCHVYCDEPNYEAVRNACVQAFGEGYSVVVRQCPAGLVPEACGSLTEYSDVGVLCPGYAEPLDVLCCWE